MQTSYNTKDQKKTKFFIALYILFIMGIFALRAGRFLIFLFPSSMFLGGLALFRTNPYIYIELYWWVIFFTPLVRRIIDYQSGYLTFGPWDLGASLYGILLLFPILSSSKKINKRNAPYTICLSCVIYSAIIGVIYSDISLDTLVYVTIQWMNPILLSMYLFVNWKDYIIYEKIVKRVFVWAIAIISLYGLFQFFTAPPWDVFWLENSAVSSFGKPVPLGIRVVGTLGSPHECGMTLLAGIIVLVSQYNLRNFFVSLLAILCLSLTNARSVWLGFSIALIVLVISLKPRIQFRLFWGVIVLGLIVFISILFIDPIYDVVATRLQSFIGLQDDVSLQSRLGKFNKVIYIALSEVVGRGIGTSSNILANDNGFIKTLLAMGWLGFLPYIFGMLVYLSKLFRGNEYMWNPFITASNSIVIGIFVQFLLIPIFENVNGILLWGFLGLRMAAHQYYSTLSTAYPGKHSAYLTSLK